MSQESHDANLHARDVMKKVDDYPIHVCELK